MRHSNARLLVYIGLADAYAAAVEYVKLPEHRMLVDQALAFNRYLTHPIHGQALGRYTDDTEMSAANAHVLLEHGAPWNELMFANAWVDEFVRGGKRKGYSRNFQDFLERCPNGVEFVRTISRDSDKNGAAMRAVPFGVLPTVEQALQAATLQARLTHDTPEGRFSARAVALMSHFALYEAAALTELPLYCLSLLPSEDIRCFGHVFTQRWDGAPVKNTGSVSVAITMVHAVADLVAHERSLMGILERVIRWGGDTDSVAAIAWGIASSRSQEEPLPAFLERDLEGGSPTTGAAYLQDLSERLMQKYA